MASGSLSSGLEGIECETLTRFVLEEQRKHKDASGDLTLLLSAVQISCKVIESCVRRAGIAKLYGLAGDQNVQGEDQKKLDVIANDAFKMNVQSTEKVSVMVSEEEDLAIVVSNQLTKAKYAIAFDPLDGSSNIDANVSIGTIFSIFRIEDPENVKTPEDAANAILQPGRDMVCAGYAMYGSATNMVIAFQESGVQGFTLDTAIGEFVLTHPNIRIPSKTTIYSCNEGNMGSWSKGIQDYIQSIKFPGDGQKPYSARYVGSMVADVHRTLLYGGIFFYPADKKSPTGKLRLLYEGAPMAFLMEKAGGKALLNGTDRVLDVIPTNIHERTPVFLGSPENVDEIASFLLQE
mmetsp:Transcript_2734/g.4971  ORF Transcript_2734/g.4971 Transcript_2734/m.4971 type:complete len:349 (+) Transcript_2734:88-1134(+)